MSQVMLPSGEEDLQPPLRGMSGGHFTSTVFSLQKAWWLAGTDVFTFPILTYISPKQTSLYSKATRHTNQQIAVIFYRSDTQGDVDEKNCRQS